LMYMDQFLYRLCTNFTKQIQSLQDERNIIKGVENTVGPYLRQKEVQKNNNVIVVMGSDEMIAYLNQGLGMNMSENEMTYIMHCMGREDLEGDIVYNELFQILKNFIFKERLFLQSI
jgi:hypothetical protein